MPVTFTELQADLGKYLALSLNEDIFITQDGNIIAKLSNPFADRVQTAKSLFGIVPDDITFDEAREKKINEL